MQIGTKVQAAMNDQIHKELESAYLYLAMSAYFSSLHYPGAASWMRAQGQEELGHAIKLTNFVEDRDGVITYRALSAPTATFASPLAAFEAAADHEATVSASIYALFELAGKEKDYATQALLQWFITEQVEEEKTSREIVDTLRRIGSNTSGLHLFDRELGGRSRAG